MSTQPAPAKEPQTQHLPNLQSTAKTLFLQFFAVLGVAAIVATVFTAWTPGRYPPGSPQAEAALTNPEVPENAPVPDEPNAPTKTPRAVKLIGIVAGHWKNNNDPGAVCSNGIKEVDVNLNIASIVQKLLVEKGYQVDLLAEFDKRLLGYEADAIISIHNDSCEYVNDQATGYKVATSLAGYQPERSTSLAACIRGRYGAASGLPVHSTSVTVDMTEYHAFSEIDPSTPAAIIETGFLNLDQQFLTEKPEVAAQGIVSGILCFLNNEDIYQAAPQATLPAATPAP